MSNQLRNRLKSKSEEAKPDIYSLSKEDWDQLAASLMVAEEIFKGAERVTPEEWQRLTEHMIKGEGFPSIIYHDKPVISREPKLAK